MNLLLILQGLFLSLQLYQGQHLRTHIHNPQEPHALALILIPRLQELLDLIQIHILSLLVLPGLTLLIHIVNSRQLPGPLHRQTCLSHLQ